jgi:3-oxoacyl-[acyl-carrier-protein] synthase-3
MVSGLFGSSQTVPYSDLRSQPDIRWPALRQEGQTVFRWAAYELVDVASRAMKESGVEPDQIDVFVPHQANLRIIDRLAKSLRFPPTVRIARDVVHMGNTSAASIPLAIESMLANHEARGGDLALLLGFGAGLSYGAVVVALP